MSDDRLFLKVKIKSLAAEARIIRDLELKYRGYALPEGATPNQEAILAQVTYRHDGLYRHRVQDVRTEQRATLLAYAYIRGKPYGSQERPGSMPPGWLRVAQLVRKYGNATGKKLKDAEVAEILKTWAAPTEEFKPAA